MLTFCFKTCKSWICVARDEHLSCFLPCIGTMACLIHYRASVPSTFPMDVTEIHPRFCNSQNKLDMDTFPLSDLSRKSG